MRKQIICNKKPTIQYCHIMTYVRQYCPNCGKPHTVLVNTEDLRAWENGELIQRAMPYLTPTQREQLITGYCEECVDWLWS